ncbi:hypothetical protein J4G48_0040440 [Bradyrhizobium barranii subsp. apii]|uniref:hypothetical protein n=1 Tax=Bradyrhizobium barranii TaxID=2992140 RepID=UPI001AA1738E|nr:hypothetical protein [Bradyrhizobium barranii]UPT95426.1 hypothetical protein J4G48_0040440 [Bradyrhizobium barranii subsp. apii]
MKKKRTSKADAARIQRAVTGLMISLTTLTRVYAHAEQLIADGADDAALAAGIRHYLGQ